MPDAAPTRTKTGCQSCRLRHVKCDDKQPSCSRCSQSGIECIRLLNVRFCHNLNPTIPTEKGPEEFFRDSQVWVSTKGTLSFVDETRDTVAIYETASASLNGCSPKITLGGTPPVARPSSHASTRPPVPQWEIHDILPSAEDLSPYELRLSSPSKRRRMTNDAPSFPIFTPRSDGLDSPSLAFPSIGDYTSPALTAPNPAHDTSPRQGSSIGPSGTNEEGQLFGSDRAESRGRRETFSSVYSFGGTPSAPYPEVRQGLLSDPNEARLLHHFVEKLASSFDLTDSLCHFRNEIPQRAVKDPILLNAILAASARHLSRVSDIDPYIADKYHQECIQHLIPMLNDENAVLNENLLASTVILRYLEEIEVPLSGQHPDSSRHLIGTHAFISAQESSAMLGGLRLAAFWVGLRQEIYVAFVNQRSIIPPLQHCNVDRSFEPADEATWANRIIVHCAETIRYCFGLHEHERTTTRYMELLQYCEDWLKYTPTSYNPIFYRQADEDHVFPEVMYLSDATVTGVQHYHLTLILLKAHDPRIPSLGPRRMAALRKMDTDIRHHVKMLCGLAVSNSGTPPNFVTASMAVAMAGDKFTEPKEQEACLNILRICELDHGWPTTTARSDLKEAWGWANSMPT